MNRKQNAAWLVSLFLTVSSLPVCSTSILAQTSHSQNLQNPAGTVNTALLENESPEKPVRSESEADKAEDSDADETSDSADRLENSENAGENSDQEDKSDKVADESAGAAETEQESSEETDASSDEDVNRKLVFAPLPQDWMDNGVEISADVIVISATGGCDQKNVHLDEAVEAVLQAGKIPALAHTAKDNWSEKDGREEALYFYQQTKQWKGQILPVLLFDLYAREAGPVYVRTFTDNVKELLEAVPVVVSDSENKTDADWSVFEDACPLFWDDWSYSNFDFTQSDLDELMDMQAEDAVNLYRLYNPRSGEHLFTADENERDYLCSGYWKYESVAWRYDADSKSPVYRLFNPHSGDHLYTCDENEKEWLSTQGGWKYEIVAWQQTEGGKPEYRLFNPNVSVGSHHYTTSLQEYEALGAVGWKKEGVAFTQILPFVQRNEGNLASYILEDACYNTNGIKVDGVQKVNGKYYYFDPQNDGLLCTQTGRRDISGGTICIQEDASLKSGRVKENGSFVYYDPKNSCLLRTTQGLFKTPEGEILVEDGARLATGLRNSGGWKYFYPSSALMARNTWIDVPASENNGTAKRVYFGADGNMLVGEHKIDGKRYIFGSDGTITNQNDLKVQAYCEQVYNQVGRDLRAVYRWTAENIGHNKNAPVPYPVPAGYKNDEYYTTVGFETRAGNCYIYASTFQQLARNLGYNARLYIGNVSTISGPEIHCWTEIYENGVWYIYDPLFQEMLESWGPYAFYKMNPSNTPFIYYH